LSLLRRGSDDAERGAEHVPANVGERLRFGFLALLLGAESLEVED